VVVKPSREGSSVGVSIVDEREALLEAVKEASRYGWPVLIERYIKGREIQIGILDDEVLGGVEVRPKRRFYDYTAKYTPGETEYILPPEVDESLYDRCKQVGLRAHRAIGCKGATRVDLLVTEDEIYVLEVNTIPGMTETSLLPKIAALSGYSFDELIERIVRLSYREKGHEKA
ncbi:MAG: ATP-grasp domain-containing protein, partial [Nitrospirae bacterium]